jgi:hypothetical protein
MDRYILATAIDVAASGATRRAPESHLVPVNAVELQDGRVAKLQLNSLVGV